MTGSAGATGSSSFGGGWITGSAGATGSGSGAVSATGSGVGSISGASSASAAAICWRRSRTRALASASSEYASMRASYISGSSRAFGSPAASLSSSSNPRSFSADTMVSVAMLSSREALKSWTRFGLSERRLRGVGMRWALGEDGGAVGKLGCPTRVGRRG